MKKALSLLTAYMLFQAQTWALTGGPFSDTGFSSVVGTYSGYLFPILPETAPGVASNTSLTENSLGLFIFGSPQTGVAAGSVAFFTNGEVFVGTLVGLADPGSGEFRAIIDGNTTLKQIINVGGTTITQNAVGQALGKMEAKIDDGGVGVLQRIRGTAHVDLFLGGFEADGSVLIAETFDFDVDGFRQSSDPASGGSLGSIGNLGGGAAAP